MSVKRYHRIRCWLPCVCICLFLYVWFVIIICALIQLCMYMLADLIFNWIFGYKNTQNKYFWFYSNVVLTTVHNTLQIPLPKTDFDHKLHNSVYPTRKPRLNEATVALKLVDLAAANVTMRPDAIEIAQWSQTLLFWHKHLGIDLQFWICSCTCFISEGTICGNNPQ